jgi:hypothetical protein
MQNVVDKFILMSSVKSGTAKYPFDIGKENASTKEVHPRKSIYFFFLTRAFQLKSWMVMSRSTNLKFRNIPLPVFC